MKSKCEGYLGDGSHCTAIFEAEDTTVLMKKEIAHYEDPKNIHPTAAGPVHMHRKFTEENGLERREYSNGFYRILILDNGEWKPLTDNDLPIKNII